MQTEIESLKSQIKDQLIAIEEKVWKKIPFEQKGIGYKFQYSLADEMKLTDEYLEMDFTNELYGVDHSDFSEKLRKIYPQFSDDPEFAQDLQMVFDENFLNHLLLSLLHNEKVFSLRDLLLRIVPEQYTKTLIMI